MAQPGSLAALRRIAASFGPALRALACRTEGATAIALGLALPALVGLGFLVVDGSRHYNLHTSLQSAADAFALAGAAELDRRPDSIRRAERAISNLVENDARFAASHAALTVDDISVRYLEALPSSDAAPITAAYEADDSEEARYVEVSVHPVALGGSVLSRLLGTSGPVQTSASAVAGFDQAVCEFSPLFICNPFEGSDVSIFEAVEDPSWRRRLIALRLESSSGQHGPGNYGFLSSPAGNGADRLRELIAIDRPGLCFLQSRLQTEPGFMTTVRDAFNVRFDIYEGPMNKYKSNPSFRPARNVRKGYVGNSCNQAPAEDPAIVRGLPRDTCLADGACEPVGQNDTDRFGDGYWDFEGYWETNFGNAPKPRGPNGEFYSNANPPSRYDVYRYEIDSGLSSTHAGGNGNNGETGDPVCYSGGPSTLDDDPDRRMLNVAVIDCIAHADDLQGRGHVPATGFARVFLTEPVGEDGDQTIWGEMVDLIEPGTPGAKDILRDIVQLQR